jgi:hypothetical protein
MARPDSSRLSLPFFDGGVEGVIDTSREQSSSISSTSNDQWILKVAKVGVVSRKDDLLEGGKKATNRKWKQSGVILTGSQLLLFRETTWVNTLLAHRDADGHVVVPQGLSFKPDELISVEDSIAVFDKSYKKVGNHSLVNI